MTTDHLDPISRLIAWHTGEPLPAREAVDADATRTLVLSDPGQLDAAVGAGLVGPDTLVLLPAGGTPAAPPAGQVVEYEGAVATPSTELSIGEDFFLYCQDYATSEYLSVIGPTVVGVFTEEDFHALVRDADAARTSGTFADFLRSPAVRVANLPALVGAAGDGPRQRLFAAPDGAVSTSPVGTRLGGLGDGMAVLEEEWLTRNSATTHPCSVSLGAVVPDDVRSAAVAERPWLGRYVVALETIREFALRGIADLRFSGFGHRLNEELAHAPAADDAAEVPMLAWDDSSAFLRDPVRRKTYRFNRDAAPAVEAVLATGSVEAAAALVPAAAAQRAADQLADYGLAAPAAGEAVAV